MSGFEVRATTRASVAVSAFLALIVNVSYGHTSLYVGEMAALAWFESAVPPALRLLSMGATFGAGCAIAALLSKGRISRLVVVLGLGCSALSALLAVSISQTVGRTLLSSVPFAISALFALSTLGIHSRK